MKNKILACILAALLALTLALPVLADSEARTVEPTLLPVYETDIDGWYTNDDTRALLVASVAFDLALAGYEDIEEVLTESLSTGSVYVGRDQSYLSVFFFTAQNTVLTVYKPATNEMRVSLMETTFTTSQRTEVMENMYSSGSLTSYHEVDTDAVVTMMETILSILEE